MACVGFALSARAEVHRFAVVAGNNRGGTEDVPLRYAESDAERVTGVLRDLGGFPPDQVVWLAGQSSDRLVETLLRVEQRVRRVQQRAGHQALLFVYYSGHADAEGLRQEGSHLDFAELTSIVQQSAAEMRVLVVDACRSGAITRRKGGRRVGAPELLPTEDLLRESLPGHGVAFLAASAAGEDAQESDELGGSFFTHALISGWMGAADADGDGAVSLAETYRYAQQETIRSTSRSLAGTQHPSFKLDLHGQGQFVLSRPVTGSERGRLVVPEGLGFVVLQGEIAGNVVAEVPPYTAARGLSLRPGEYFLRGRGEEHLFEGEVTVESGQTVRVDAEQLRTVPYVNWLRKGWGREGPAHSVQAGGTSRSKLPNASTGCAGLQTSYQVDFRWLSWETQAGFCRSQLRNDVVQADVDEVRWVVGPKHSWDAGSWTWALAGRVGGVWLRQHFAPSLASTLALPGRNALSPVAGVAGSVRRALGGGAWWARSFVDVGIEVEWHLLSIRPDAVSERQLRAAGAVRGSVGVGHSF